MQAQVHEASVAFTYAWWLTGDDIAAEAAVREAAHQLPDIDDAEVRLVGLLRSVRNLAAPERTMCPASELALLHDGQSLPLDLAADLAEVALAEARTELAHGRLEALLQTVDTEFDHPERLGGLAVGNPPDIAHSRTCESCARTHDLLRQGRQELAALPPVPVPAELLAAVTGLDAAQAEAAASGPVRVSRRSAGGSPEPAPQEAVEAEAVAEADAATEPEPAAEADAATESEPAAEADAAAEPTAEPVVPIEPVEAQRPAEPVAEPAVESEPEPEAPASATARSGRPILRFDDLEPLDLTTSTKEEDREAAGRRRRPWVGVAAIVFGVAVLLSTALTSPQPDADPQLADAQTGAEAPAPDEPASPGQLEAETDAEGDPGAAPEVQEQEPEGPEPGGEAEPAPADPMSFTITDVGVLPAGAAEPERSGAEIAADEPLRVSVRYAGAAEGVVLVASTTLPDEQAPDLGVTLSAQRSSHVFLWTAPPLGWDPGQHQIRLLADGELAGVVDVTIIEAP